MAEAHPPRRLFTAQDVLRMLDAGIVIRGDVRDYADHLPGDDDVLLAVEISHTTLAADRAKSRIYARAGVPEYWLLNLTERQLERHTHPADGDYGRKLILAESESVSPPERDDIAWRVGELLD